MATRRTERLTDKERTICNEAAAGCVFSHVRRASRVLAQRYNEALRESGLLGTQFSLLVALALRGPSAISALGEALAMDRTTLTRNLRPLERDGFVAVAPGEDRRTRIVSLAPRGEDALARALPLWRRAQEEAVRDLGRGRWRALIEILGGIAARG